MMVAAPPDVRVPPPGPRSRELAARLAAVECPSLDARRAARQRASGEDHVPIVYATARGCNVTDVDGNRYVDLAAGFGALALGHRPDVVDRAVAEQQSRLGLALGELYASEAKLDLCERLSALFPEPGARVMLGSSGADAVSAGLKTAMLATGRPGVVAFEGSYHGLSHGPLAACGLDARFRQPFAAQLNAHVTFAPYPKNEGALDAAMTVVRDALATGDVGAILVEPVLGRGGCVVPPPAFLPALRAECDRAGSLLVADEVWTALGRSGSWLASVDAGVVPDVICLGKALGAGYAVSACVGSEQAMASWRVHGGSTIHTATHAGNPIGCAAAVATLEAIGRADLPSRARRLGAWWMNRLRDRLAERHVAEITGRGLMVGVSIEGGSARALAVTRRLLMRGWIVVIGGTQGDVLTLTPSLAIEQTLLDAFADALVEALAPR